MHTWICSTSGPWTKKHLHNLKNVCKQATDKIHLFHCCKIWFVGEIDPKLQLYTVSQVKYVAQHSGEWTCETENMTLTTLHDHNRDFQETQWLNTDAQIISTDLSHINLPPVTHVELSSAVFTLPLSFTSALRVISSAICSIASQIKNALRMTNLITSSQKYGAARNWGLRELMSDSVTTARSLHTALGIFNTVLSS